MKQNAAYYDDFAAWYERERHHGYHAHIDHLQVGVAEPLCRDREILEVGCGTGMILKEISRTARRAVGVDISHGMLAQARARGLDVVEGDATSLPFPEASFDAVYSFKVLAHVQQVERAMGEVARVLRPGGVAALEFYNKHSLRYLIKRLKRPHQVSEATTDDQVYTRYDTLAEARAYMPASLRYTGVRGVRVFTPFAQAHMVPGVGQVLRAVEERARDAKLTARLGGFMVVLLERL